MSMTDTSKGKPDGRRLGRAWRNAGVAAIAVGVLALGTQGVLALVGAGAVKSSSRAALEECGRGNVESVSAEGFSCAE